MGHYMDILKDSKSKSLYAYAREPIAHDCIFSRYWIASFIIICHSILDYYYNVYDHDNWAQLVSVNPTQPNPTQAMSMLTSHDDHNGDFLIKDLNHLSTQ